MQRETSSFALGFQAAKGSAAANYVRGIFTSHRHLATYDVMRVEGEHRGLHQRPSAHQSTAQRTGVIVPWSVSFALRPYLIGQALLMAGYKCVTTENAPEAGAYTHTFTEADVDEIGYGSMLEYLGEGADRYGVRSVDGKANNLRINASRDGITVDVGGFALTPGDAVGSETETAEVDVLLNPATGSFTLTSSDITAMGTPRTHEWTQDNPLDDSEQQLHSLYRASLAENGRTRSGSMGGLVFAEDVFRELAYAGGSSPVIAVPEAQLSWSFESPGVFVGTTKYSLTWTYANCEVALSPFDVSGDGRLLHDVTYTVRDSVSGSPSTVVLINDLASYAGS